MTVLYLIRHCQSAGPGPEEPLTAEGRAQAERLADVLDSLAVDRVVSSPYRRARQSVEPFARRRGLPIEVDDRLRERTLTWAPAPEWVERVRRTFEDLDLCVDGGESSRSARERAVAAIRSLLDGDHPDTAVATHGQLLTLLLGHFDPHVGFDAWRGLTNPDLFQLVVFPGGAVVERIWH